MHHLQALSATTNDHAFNKHEHGAFDNFPSLKLVKFFVLFKVFWICLSILLSCIYVFMSQKNFIHIIKLPLFVMSIKNT
jgi:hypothetical protein